MGVKDLWYILSPYSEKKPLNVLRGTTVAIDLAGWVCEGLNVVDYFVHPRHYLKNLFFRTCHLIWEDITPVFVLEGDAPSLKNNVIAKRKEIQFRGVQPKAKNPTNQSDAGSEKSGKPIERKRLNQLLKQCENLLRTMGIDCIQGPGEAEAYCAFLNKNKLVDGVISQDSDCFAYGATRVYRNFSISMQGTQAAQGGAVDIYDMEKIQQALDFGQKKVIAMALLCGCDYCPTGVDGVGRDGVLKLFQKYKDYEILDRIRGWRIDGCKYKALELRVDDKNVCANCGHMGSTQSHTKNGCGICRSKRACNDMLWKEERLLIKAELSLRKKALSNPDFPNEEIIDEFLREPKIIPQINLTWKQPNIINFIKHVGPLLQWTEIYCFQKFFPILARWQIYNDASKKNISSNTYITPARITKERIIKGVSSIEIFWQAQKDFFGSLILDEELQVLLNDHDSKESNELWTTKEPLFLVQAAYPMLLESFYNQAQKSKCLQRKKEKKKPPLTKNALENFADLLAETNDIVEDCKAKRPKNKKKTLVTKNLQMIDKFFKPKYDVQNFHFKNENLNQPVKYLPPSQSFLLQCSTPISKFLPSELESDCETDSMNLSAAINNIVARPLQREITNYTGRILHYETLMSASSDKLLANSSKDDLDLFRAEKRNRLLTNLSSENCLTKKFSKDDSFDLMIKASENCLDHLNVDSHVNRFKRQHILQ